MADVPKTQDASTAKTATTTAAKHGTHHRERAKPQLIPQPLSAAVAPHGQRTPAQLHSQEASRAFYQSTVVPYGGESVHPHYPHWPATHVPSFAWLPPSTPAPYPGVQLAHSAHTPQPHYPMWTPLHGHHQTPYQYPQAAYAHYYPAATPAAATPQPAVTPVVHNEEANRANGNGNGTKFAPVSDKPDEKGRDKAADLEKPPAKNDSDGARDRSGTSGSDSAKQAESDVTSKNARNSNIQPPIRKARKPYTITKHREVWTEKEHSLFLQALQLFNRDWKRIESYIGTKTVLQIRSHAQKHFSKVTKYKTGEYIPPPRPKRRATRPYPRSRGVGSSSASKTEKTSSSKTPTANTASDSGVGSSDIGGNTSGNGKIGSGGTSEFTTDDGSSSVPRTRRPERPSSQPSSSPKKESRRSSECLPPVPPPVAAASASPSPPPVASEKKPASNVEPEKEPPRIPPPPPQQQQQPFMPGYNPYYYSAGAPYAHGHHYMPPHHPYSHPSMPPHPHAHPQYIACYDGTQYPAHNTYRIAHPIQHSHQHAVHHHSQHQHLYHHPVAQTPPANAIPVAKDAPQKLVDTTTLSISVQDKEANGGNNTKPPVQDRDRPAEHPATAPAPVPANPVMENAPHPVWSEGAAARRAHRLRLIRAKKQKSGKQRPGEEEVIDVDAIASVEQRKHSDVHMQPGVSEKQQPGEKPVAVAALLNSEPEEPRAAIKPPVPVPVILVGTGGAVPAPIPMNDEAVAGFSGSDGSPQEAQESRSRSGTPEEDPNSSSGDDGRGRMINSSRGSSPTEPNSGGSREDTPSAPDTNETNASQNNSPPEAGENRNNEKEMPKQKQTDEYLKDAAKALSKYQSMGINSLLNNNRGSNEKSNDNYGTGDQKRGRSPVQERRKNENGTGINMNMGRFENENGVDNDNDNNDRRQWQRRKHAEEDVMRERSSPHPIPSVPNRNRGDSEM